MGKHLTREEKRRIQRFRANLAGALLALALVALGMAVHAGLIRLGW